MNYHQDNHLNLKLIYTKQGVFYFENAVLALIN